VVIAIAKRARYWNALSAILATKVGGLTRVYVTVPALPQFVEKVEADTVKLQSMDCPLALSAISDCPSVLQLPEPGLPGPVHVKVPPCRKSQIAKFDFTECPFKEVALHFPKKPMGIGVGVGVMGVVVDVGVGLDGVGVGVGFRFPEGVLVGVGPTVLVGVGVPVTLVVGVLVTVGVDVGVGRDPSLTCACSGSPQKVWRE
jgi:hypothetical protein